MENNNQPTNYIILQPKDYDKAAEHLKFKGLKIVSLMPEVKMIAVEKPKGQSYHRFEKELVDSELFNHIEEDVIHECESYSLPNDPLLANSWYVKSQIDKDIDADLAWDLLPATAISRTVAIMDGHGMLSHPDLDANISATYNSHTQTFNIAPENSYERHMAACAGIVGAVWNNGIGIAGLGKNLLKLRLIKFGYNASSTGSFSASSLDQVRGINNALSDPTVAAISCSWGASYSSAVQLAINEANAKGVMVFASTGNSNSSTLIQYPASYNYVIATASSTSADTRSSFSNYGGPTFNSAPGSSIATTDNVGSSGYTSTDYTTNFSGTSAACPVNAAVGALLRTVQPNAPIDTIKKWIALGCEKVGGYSYVQTVGKPYSTWSKEMGYGRVNMYNSLNLALGNVITPEPITVTSKCTLSSYSVSEGSSITITATQTISNFNAPATSYSIRYYYSNDLTITNATLIGTDISNLGAGVSSEVESTTFTVPQGTGIKYIHVTDNNGKIISSAQLTVIGASTGNDLDMEISFITPPPNITCADYAAVKLRLTNTGTVPITSYKINYTNRGSIVPVSVSFSTPMGPGSTRSITITNWFITELGPNVFTANIVSVNGVTDDVSNNTITAVTIKEVCQ
jgi:hypothetical protein